MVGSLVKRPTIPTWFIFSPPFAYLKHTKKIEFFAKPEKLFLAAFELSYFIFEA